MSETPKKSSNARKRRWSATVTKHSDALDLQAGVFRLKEPKSMPTKFGGRYINRAGKKLPAARRKTLERAKVDLRKLFGKD